MADSKFTIDENDPRLTDIETERAGEITDVENTYNGMINDVDSYTNAQIEATKNYAETTAKNQQEQTDFAIDQINQQKEQAGKDYTKEQSGAYVDWQKQSSEHGVNAEKMAMNGMSNSGYSESSQVSTYNTYQNRVATARESYNKAVLNYDNSITQARLANNAALAEIAYNALSKQLELSLAGFQYKNTLMSEMVNQKNTVNARYDNKWASVYSAIQNELEMQQADEQFYASLAHDTAEREASQSWQEAQAQIDREFTASENDKDRTDAKTAQNRNNLMAMIEMGYNPSNEEIAAAGMTRAQVDSLRKGMGIDKNDAETVDYSAVTDAFGTMSEDSVLALEDIGAITPYVEDGVMKFKINTDGWSKVEGKEGGTNTAGINRNAYIRTPDGRELKSSDLLKELKDAGMPASEAKKFIEKLQSDLGILGKDKAREAIDNAINPISNPNMFSMADSPAAQVGSTIGTWIGNGLKKLFGK